MQPAAGIWHLLLQLPQHFEQIFIVRLIGNGVDVFVSELAFLIDDEERALGNAVVGTISAVRFGYFAFGMKVAEKIVGKSAEALGPSAVAGNAVN